MARNNEKFCTNVLTPSDERVEFLGNKRKRSLQMRAMMLRSEFDHLVSGHTVAEMTLGEAPAGHQYPVHLHTHLQVALAISAILDHQGAPTMSPTPPNQGSGRYTAWLLPGHLLGLLPCGRHLDHVPQKGHPTFFDQQGAVLVRCGVRSRQQGIREGFLSAWAQRPTLAARTALPEGWEEGAGLGEGTAATRDEPCLPSPEFPWERKG